MNPSGLLRAVLSVIPISASAVALLGTTAMPAQALTIDIPCAGTWNWNATTQTLSCQTSPPPAPGVPSCTLAANPTSLPAGGGSVTLTATCTGSPTTFAWTGTGLQGGATTTSSTNTANITATASFTVTAHNDAGDSAPASRSVQVGTTTGGLSCPGFSKTLFVNWDWASTLSRVDTYVTQGGIGTNGILVIPFIATGPADNIAVQLSATNYPASQMINTKRLAISRTPCDLNPPEPASAVTGSTPSLSYVVGTAPISAITGKPQAASLTPGDQYYVNIAERSGVNNANPFGTQSCISGYQFYPNCELRITLQKPH
jgi:hypothetical protein